jgi:hypothetical protein
MPGLSQQSRLMLSRFIALLSVAILTACTGMVRERTKVPASDVAAIYISPAQYQNYGCVRLSAEIGQTQKTISEMSVALERGDYDKSGGVLIVPGAILYDNRMAGDETYAKANELARHKGTLVALQEAAAKSNCSL